MIDYDFINAVLAKYEGKGYTRGYVPCEGGTYFGGNEPEKGKPLGASGVTIATGVDLGQQTLKGLSDMGISIEPLAVLKPYIGLKKQAAIEVLKSSPLTITAEQVREIDEMVHKYYIHNTARGFGYERFESAPKEVQAVAVSLCYQFGSPWRAVSPSLGMAWEAMQAGKYREAAAYLSNPNGWSAEHRQYLLRRRQEAELLNTLI